MRKLREILRLHLELGLSAWAIARSCSLSPSTVGGYLSRSKVAKLSWPLVPELDEDGALTRLLFSSEGHPTRNRPEPDWARVHLELRKKHVTKQLLWEEYKAEHRRATSTRSSASCSWTSAGMGWPSLIRNMVWGRTNSPKPCSSYGDPGVAA